MPIEGVLAKGENLKTAQPTKLAKALYDALRSQHNTLLLTRNDEAIAKWWLNRENIKGYSAVLLWDQVMNWEHWKVDQIREALAQGWEIFAYVDTSPDLVDEVRSMGVTGICVSYPSMTVGWKEVEPPRPWTDVVATVESTPPKEVSHGPR